MDILSRQFVCAEKSRSVIQNWLLEGCFNNIIDMKEVNSLVACAFSSLTESRRNWR